MSGGKQAVLLLNRAATAQRITLDWPGLGFPETAAPKIRDLWGGASRRPGAAMPGAARPGAARPFAARPFATDVAAHGVVMLVLEP